MFDTTEQTLSENESLRQQIVSAEFSLARLKAKLNSQSLTARLPPEVLCEIFLEQATKLRQERLSTDDAYDRPPRLIHQGFYDWLNVSHVCHRWRQVALGCTKLWTWIAYDCRVSEDYLEMLLSRSRGLPLTCIFPIFEPASFCPGCINTNNFVDRYYRSIDQLKSILPRIRELIVFTDSEEDHDSLWGALDSHAESLEILRFEAVGIALHVGMRLPAINLRSEVFASRTPRLHSLHFANIAVDWPNTLFCPSLKHLEISKCEFDSGNDVHALLSTLRALSLLETLKLVWERRYRFHEFVDGDDEVVTLPNLKQLHICAECERLAALLLHIKLPLTTSLHLSTLDMVTASERQHFQRAFRTLFDKSPIHRIEYALGVPIQHSPTESAVCRIWIGEGDAPVQHQDERWNANGLPTPRLTLECMADVSMDQPIPTVLQVLDLTQVRSLEINGSTTWRVWASALQCATSLSALRISGMAAFTIPSLLGEGRGALHSHDVALQIKAGMEEWYWARFGKEDPSGAVEDRQEQWEMGSFMAEILNEMHVDRGAPEAEAEESGGSAANALFPELRILQIADVDLPLPDGRKSKGLQGYPHAAPVDIVRYKGTRTKYGFDVAALAKCLKLRRAQGIRDFERVEFSGCHCETLELLSPLAGLVTDVRWDGQAMKLDKAEVPLNQ